MTGHSKIDFFVGFPLSVQDFFCLKLRSLRLFWFKISQFVPFLHVFDRFCGFVTKKGTNCEILHLNNPLTHAFKGNLTKKSCTDGETLQKKWFFSVTSHFKANDFFFLPLLFFVRNIVLPGIKSLNCIQLWLWFPLSHGIRFF